MLGVLVLCFFVSGATALVYEMVWLRMLGLVFGHTVYALTTVLAAFMAGLGLGSLVFGRVAARVRDPVRAYGVLEIGVGLSCALVPVLLWLASFLYVGLHRLLAGSYTAFSLVQFLVVLVVLLVPTTLMGGTLPILTQALVRGGDQPIARTVGMLYSVNTFGAVLGVVAAGYWLLPALGNRATVALAVVANLLVGVLVVAYSRRLRGALPEPAGPVAPLPAVSPPELPAARDVGARLTVLALGISGAVSMIYEVAWTRALALVIGSSTYAFTAMLVAFLLGIAGGAAVYALVWGTRRATPALFAALQAGIGLAALFVLLVFERLHELFILSVKRWGTGNFVELVQFVVSAHAMLPSTLLIGATFPCAVAVWARDPDRAGEDVGRLYAVNTAGAIVGAVLAGFALIPALGVHASVKVGIAANLALAAVLALLPLRPVAVWRWGLSATALIAAAWLVFIPSWDPVIMSSGAYLYADSYAQQTQSWDMTRDAEMSTGDYLSLALSGLGRETDVGVVQQVIAQVKAAIEQYATPDNRSSYRDRLAVGTHDLLLTSAAGSDHQLAYMHAFTKAARTAEHAGFLREILDGVGVPEGLSVDTDLRWTLLAKLVVLGAATGADIDRELARDDTASGRVHAAYCRAAIPSVEAKDAAWAAAVDSDSLPNSMLTATIGGFVQPDQRDLLRRYIDRYFASLGPVWSGRTNETAQTVTIGLYPALLTDDNTLERTNAFLNGDDGHVNPSARRLVSEGRDGVERALRAQRRDRETSS